MDNENNKPSEKVEQAVECFKREGGYNCAQSIFATYSEAFGIDRDMAFKLSCGLGGGMGKTGQACGAVSGAVLALGLKYGRYLPEDRVSKEHTYSLVQEFEKMFIERNGSIKCDELLGFEMRTADRDTVKEITKQRCPRFVQDAAEILETFLE
ncbi:MAG: C-GCAxxG-C-C family protein [Oscillospiraceae bacterium]|nr:C-GCAxxG-C-C family protein [Oscillospiraceae bacterium]